MVRQPYVVCETIASSYTDLLCEKTWIDIKILSVKQV